MRTILDSPDRLVLENVPWILSGIIVLFILLFVGVGLSTVLSGNPEGFMFVAGGVVVGGAGFAAFVRRTQVDFDRPRGVVRVTRRTVLGTKVEEKPLADVVEAVLHSSSSSEGSTTRRAVLVLRTGGPMVIDPVYVSGRGPGRTAETINRWLWEAMKAAANARPAERP